MRALLNELNSRIHKVINILNAGYVKTVNGESGNVTIPAPTPAGSNTQIQYNNSGAFGASPDLTFDSSGVTIIRNVNSDTRGVLTLRNLQAYGNGGNYNQHVLTILSSTGTRTAYIDGNLGRLKLEDVIIAKGFQGAGGVVLEGYNSTDTHINAPANPGSIKFFDKQYANGGVEIGKIYANTRNFVWGNDTTDIPSAKFSINDTAKGFLLPRMTKVQRDAIVNPAQGLMVYVIDNGGYISYYEAGWFKVSSVSDPGTLP